MKLLRCRSNFISQLGIRKTRKLFLCGLFVAFLYVFYVHQSLSEKVMEISKLNKNYVFTIRRGGALDFIRFTGENGVRFLRRTAGLSAKAKTLATNTSERTSIQSTNRKNNHHTEEEKYKVIKKAKIAATQEKKRSPKTKTELTFLTTQFTPFKNKNTLSKSITYSSPKGPAKDEIQARGLLKSTILPTVFKQFSEKSTNSKSALSGYLNVHVWKDVCESKVQSLREFILFPQVPSSRFKISSFQTQETGNNFGQKIIGFLHPPINGEYKFGISSNNNSELWLSTGNKTENMKRIVFVGSENETKYSEPGNYFKFSSQISKSLFLQHGEKYFIEALYKHGVGKSHFEVAWKLPGEPNFRIISQKYISMFVNDTHLKENTVSVDTYWEQNTSMVRQEGGFEPFYRLPFIDEADVLQVLPSCHYEPSYYIKGKLVRFQGARNKKNTHFAAVFPPDDTNSSLPLVEGEDVWWTENNIGNELVSESVALKMVQRYMEALRTKHSRVYDLRRIITVEQVQDKRKGDRFLLELELWDNKRGRNVRLSEFVYKPKDTAGLCTPNGFQWNKNTTVNIIVPLRNSGRWAFYLVQNIAEIIKQSGDQKVKLVIVDYESSDIDIHRLIKKSSIKNYAIVTIPKKEEFRRAEAMQRGSEAVTDPHSILFLCDLHLRIPATLIDIIRKHCVEGKMAFAPVVKRLKCGFYPKRLYGYWETLGFGLFAIYKSDYDHVGGMNVAEFKGWGGEDWELLDRVLESHREVERLKISGFYHFFHPSLNGYNQRLHV